MARDRKRNLRALAAGVISEEPEEPPPAKIQRPSRAPVDVQASLRSLESALDGIFNRRNSGGLIFEGLYRQSFNLVDRGNGEALYSMLKSSLEKHLVSYWDAIHDSLEKGLLQTVLRDKWLAFTNALALLNCIFAPLDRGYLYNNKGRGPDTVYATGIELWKTGLVSSQQVNGSLTSFLIGEVHRERNGETIDRGMMRAVIFMLVDIDKNMYSLIFEQPFLTATREFYWLEAQRLLESGDCAGVLKRVELRLKEEAGRVTSFMPLKLLAKVTLTVRRTVIGENMKRLVEMENTGLGSMCVQNRLEDLTRMHELFGSEDGLKLMQDVFAAHITETGKQLVLDTERQKDPVAFVQAIVDMQTKYDNIIEVSFKNGGLFLEAAYVAFQRFLNMSKSLPELLSLYLDNKLRRNVRSNDDIEEVLDKAILIFNCLHEKDLFERYFKSHLARRLITGKNADDEAERMLVLKLKTAGGYQFTVKMENMINDIKISEELLRKFNVESEPSATGIKMSVNVLTTGSWPPYVSPKCLLPREIQEVSEKFQKFYLGLHQGRRLTWLSSLGTAELKMTCDGTSKMLNVTAYQMCVLMLFNDSDRLSYDEIQQTTDIPAAELNKTLSSLLVKGRNVLLKEPGTKNISPTDVFLFNEKFSNPLTKIRLIGSIPKETAEEQKETREKQETDRKPQIEAAIVRIMKSRQVMGHNSLVNEVIQLLQPRFTCTRQAIKQRIESLIEREFLERHPDNVQQYRYLA